MNEKLKLPNPVNFKEIIKNKRNEKKVNFFNPYDVINSNNISLPRIINNEKNKKDEKDEKDEKNKKDEKNEKNEK